MLPSSPQPLSVYVHIPFCAHHCAYCDFNTYVEKAGSPLVGRTVEAICGDIEATALASPELAARTVETVFFGGGTPTYLSGGDLARILGALRGAFKFSPDAEISSEANPGSSDAGKFAEMRAAGFNRLSIGVQAFNDRLLVDMDRFHTVEDAGRAFAAARAAGFDNVSLDLMFGLPGQTMETWRESIGAALALRPEHLSLYALTLEAGTRFERLHAGGRLSLPGEDAEAEMYEECIGLLSAAGYVHYEVSNFALPGRECRHNLVYWRNEEYIAFGPGAVSYVGGRRWKRERLPAKYARAVAEGGELAVEDETLDAAGALGEAMMLGLRLRAGLPLERLRRRFGVDPAALYETPIADLTRRGLLTFENDTLRLTHAGLLLADTVVSEFLAVPELMDPLPEISGYWAAPPASVR